MILKPQTPQPQNDTVERYLAHKVVDGDTEYGLSVVELTCDAAGLWRTEIYPFTSEIHSTAFVDGTLVIERDAESASGRPLVRVLHPADVLRDV